MRHILIASLLLMVPSVAAADVNMRDAAFLKTMNEFSHPLLERSYSSRSLWPGSFGLGWCAKFERRLQILSNEKGLLKICDRQIAVNIQKKQNQWLVQGDTYDSQGRWVVSLQPKSALEYFPNGKLKTISTSQQVFHFFYDSEMSLLLRIESSHGKKVRYEQTDKNLSRVSWGAKQIQFQYDNFHNLIQIRSHRRIESITYQSEKDEISSYRNSQSDCVENFKFERISEFELKSSIEKKCPLSQPKVKTYLFLARRSPQGHLVLSSLKILGGLNESTNLP